MKIIGGVYCITCSGNGKSYIGSSYNIHKRWTEHIRDLKYNRHHSIKLQNAWNKYGSDKFSLSIIEEIVDRSLLEPIEQTWIDKLNSFNNGLNSSPFANESKRWESFRKKKCKECIITKPDGTEEIIKGIQEYCVKNNLNQGAMNRISLHQLNHYKGYHCRLASETMEQWKEKRNHVIANRPQKRHPCKKRFSSWEVTFPDGHKEKIKSLTNFCEKNGLSQGNMTEVASGRRSQHRGFKCNHIDYLPPGENSIK